MLCFYADIARTGFDKGALEKHLNPSTWKGFRYDVFALWAYGRQSLVLILDYINTVDPTQKMKFIIEIAEPSN